MLASGEPRTVAFPATFVRVCAVCAGLSVGGSPPVTAQPAGESALGGVAASVRSAGLNGAGVALVGTAGSVFTNPAGLATIRRVALEVGYRAAPFDAVLTTAAVGWRVGQFDVGVGLQHFEFGTTPVPQMPAGAPADASELLAVGSLVYRFGLIALGATGKYAAQDLVTLRHNGVSADVGLAIAVFDIMALGFAVQNLGGNWRGSDFKMARLIRTGFTMNYVDPQGTVRLLSTIEIQWPEGRRSRVVLGGEGGIVVGGVGIVGRLAHKSGLAASDGAAMTYGATLELGSIDVDFAYEPNDVTDRPSRRIGLRMSL